MFISTISLGVILGLAMFLFFFGFFFRLSIWLRGKDDEEDLRPGNKLVKKRSRIKKFFIYNVKFLQLLFSRNFFKVVRSFFVDGIIHLNLFKESRLKWFIHIFMFWGLLSFTVISILHMIGVAAAPGGLPAGDLSWYVRVFGTIENSFTGFIMDVSKIVILSGAFIAVLRFLFLKKKMKSVELKDKSAGVIISAIALASFFYEASYYFAARTPSGVAAFAPGGFILSHIAGLLKLDWLAFSAGNFIYIPAAVFFYIYITGLLLFVAFIPYGKYSHMVFGPMVAVYNKFAGVKK
ncbi:MAG: hypothetical protein FJW66_00730 [Actinobacteria bacterium]|nr:hypothetical protein [Actinomycetota bacterium]